MSGTSFYNLDPNDVLDAVELVGLEVTGHYLQLNSYENRVFEVSLEKQSSKNKNILQNQKNQGSVIVKVYRPGRWSKEAILEEHFFLQELILAEIPAIAPLEFEELPDKSILIYNGMMVAIFPKCSGRMPQEFTEFDYKKVGRTLALLHNVGQQKVARYRPTLSSQSYGYESLNLLQDWVAPEVSQRYFSSAEEILKVLSQRLNPKSFLRIHGDCHRGNLLMTDPKDGEKQFFLVDFDDFINGPVAQDFWMLFSGLKESQQELDWILTGYEDLRSFPLEQFELFQPLRGLRIIYYAAWIARRWEDPSFPKLFPNFLDYSYWAEEAEALEKIAWNL